MFGGVNFSNYAREEGIEARCTDFLSITSSNKYALNRKAKTGSPVYDYLSQLSECRSTEN